MTIYVAEIEGRAIIAFPTETEIAADAFNEWLKADLMALKINGHPLWDGISDIHFREAVAEERAMWEAEWARETLDRERTGEKEKPLAVYLVAVDR